MPPNKRYRQQLDRPYQNHHRREELRFNEGLNESDNNEYYHAFAPRNAITSNTSQNASPLEGPPAAYVVAYEAQLERNEAAGSERGGRDGLIKWAGDEMDIYAERYDVIHLLDSLPPLPTRSTLNYQSYNQAGPGPSTVRHRSPSITDSSSGWSDLPSDEETLWGLVDDETRDAYMSEKRRKWVEDLREARLRERELEDERKEREMAKGVDDDDDEEEEPPRPIALLMSHTALSLARSPDPNLLEIKIMTHHSKDDRFSFLRGRYRSAWADAKTEARAIVIAEKARERDKAGKPVQVGLGGLMGGYGSDSDSDVEEEEVKRPDESPPPPPPEDVDSLPTPPPPPPPQDQSEEARKQAERRARAAAWKLARSRSQQASAS